MRKIFMLCLVLFVFVFSGAAFAAPPPVPADGIKLDKTKKVVVFNHSTHSKLQCADCHHPVAGKEEFRSCVTAGCHDKLEQSDKSINSYYQIAHKKSGAQHNTCMSCHATVAGDDSGKKKELTGCAKSKCHP